MSDLSESLRKLAAFDEKAPAQPQAPREWLVTQPTARQEKLEWVAGEYVSKAAYDKLATRCETAEEAERFYRNEWESACERVSYANEEREGLAAELAAMKSEYENVCKFATQYEQERDRLREELDKAKTIARKALEGKT